MHLLMHTLRLLRDRQQPLVGCLLVFTLLVASLGVPVLIEPEKDVSRPYPCMHHRCGCTSAEACWHGCCCLTLSQKLAWASDHGVTPPDYVLVQTETDNPSGGSCCRHDELASDACDHGHESPPVVAETSRQAGLMFAQVDDFRRCQGLSFLWLMLSQALPPSTETRAARYRLAPCAWLRVTSQSAQSLALSPATPPPRQFAL